MPTQNQRALQQAGSGLVPWRCTASSPVPLFVGSSDPSPSPPRPADAGQENDTVPAPAVDSGGSSKKPIYKKWWFWAGVGAVAVGTVAIIAVSSGGGGREAPSSDFGAVDVF